MVKLKVIFLIACLVIAAAGFLVVRGFLMPKSASPLLPVCCHQSYFSQPDFFDQAYKEAKPLAGPEPAGIKAIMVNHHLLAGAYIAEAFNQVATTAPLTVLLISPNHFSAGNANVIASAEQWQTPYGQLGPNGGLIQALAAQHLINIDESPFTQEHGISGIVPFIKKSLPNATVVPVIFNDRMPFAASQVLADEMFKNLPPNVLIVGSFDFSHYLTDRAASFHDLKNLADVESFNLPDIYKLDIDSRPGLAFYLRLLQDGGDEKFTLLEHSNSAELTQQDFLETTSYITGYFQAGSASTTTVKSMLSFGSLVPSIIPYTNPSLAYLDRLFYGQDQTIIGPGTFLGVTIKRDVRQSYFAVESGQPVVHAAPGLAVGVASTNTGAEIYLFPIGEDSGQLKLLIAKENDTILAEMAAASNVPQNFKNEIKNGIITWTTK